jgi:hypothetical protein
LVLLQEVATFFQESKNPLKVCKKFPILNLLPLTNQQKLKNGFIRFVESDKWILQTHENAAWREFYNKIK